MAAAGDAVELVTADGQRLGATRFAPSTPASAALAVGGATGVPQGFYRRFAEHAAAAGIDVITFDYRGAGRSAPPDLRGWRMNTLDWGRQDLAAAIAVVRRPGRPTWLVGHSYGGQALGLLPAPGDVDAMVTFGTGAGWHGYMPAAERAKVWLMWSVLAPVVTAAKGYLAWRWLGMGEDLPLDAYRQWRRWCHHPHYFFGDPAAPELPALFERVTTPIAAVNALDDLWALPASRQAFMQHYTRAPWHGVDLHRRDHGSVGHMGYFRAGRESLWDATLQWLADRGGPLAAGSGRR